MFEVLVTGKCMTFIFGRMEFRIDVTTIVIQMPANFLSKNNLFQNIFDDMKPILAAR